MGFRTNDTFFRTNGFRTNDTFSAQSVFGPMCLRTNGPSDRWVFGPMGHRTNGLSDRRHGNVGARASVSVDRPLCDSAPPSKSPNGPETSTQTGADTQPPTTEGRRITHSSCKLNTDCVRYNLHQGIIKIIKRLWHYHSATRT